MRKVVVVLTILAFVLSVIAVSYAQQTTTKKPGYSTKATPGTTTTKKPGMTKTKVVKTKAIKTKAIKTKAITTKTTKKTKAKVGRGTAAVCPPGYVPAKHKKTMQQEKQYHPTKRTGTTCPPGYVEKKMRPKKTGITQRERTGAGPKCPVSGTYKK